ncbi:MAG TPA: ABC transporter substrate-binding protein [Ilumatobacteraceae bacterium]
MKRFVATTSLLLGIALLAAACGDDDDTDEPAATDATETTATGSAAETTAAPAAPTGASGDAAACADGKTLEDGTLTIATGNPAFPPYVIDDAPETGEGFEAAVAMAVARELGFEGDAVTWVRTGFDEAIQPGAKNFDFNLQQFSITDERKQTVDFSDPYYVSNQAVVGFEDSAAVGATTVADLKGLKFGAQAGTTSLEFITEVIQPDEEPFAYDDNVGAKAALEANQIDAIVVDLPTAFFITAVEIEGTQVIGQFPAEAGGTTDEFGLLFDKGNPLVECANLALAALTASGELATIEQTWMSDNAGAPVISVG